MVVFLDGAAAVNPVIARPLEHRIIGSVLGFPANLNSNKGEKVFIGVIVTGSLTLFVCS
jgi:hypothetical protein